MRSGTGQPIAPGPYNQNQFGFDFGGPILRNKLFYFVNYEGYRQTQSAIQNAYTPTAAMFNGDFSQAGVNIYDPSTYNPATHSRKHFPGKINSPRRIPAAAQRMLAHLLPCARPRRKPHQLN